MRTTLEIPDDLMAEITRLSGKTKKTDIVISALQTYERDLRKQKLLRFLDGDDPFDPDFDPIAWREMER